MASLYFLMTRWREKVRSSTPLHVSLAEISAVVGFLSSLIYLISFFGIAYVQSFISSDDVATDLDINTFLKPSPSTSITRPPLLLEQEGDRAAVVPLSERDQEIVSSVVSGRTPSHALESLLGDARRAARVRREALGRVTGRPLDGLPLDRFDYDSILGQCCEMPVGYVQLPVGVAGPLVLDGRAYYVPMATTEGCLVASTNRGCKAIGMSGGAASVVLGDGMTRAPVVKFETAKRATELKFFLEDPENFEMLASAFNRSSRFARLQAIKCSLAGRNLYMRFRCSTGDAMGMNMVSKGVQNVLDYLQTDFPDMDVVSISGNFCSDKKPAAVNWIEGRGKSVVCEAIIKEDIVKEVLKTTVQALVELNIVKNLTGSAVAGSLGGLMLMPAMS
ncbi:putative 3-hydroxy-3-methylglutaryl-coenzyme A reductase 3 [Iris pallida]|uniref:hydroxymethylglutaryl-CoA reductase (NADPH) n=1 Tax=Iris pallida TaxID=29817 RepID=A0AAX6HD18_IRIPA|nr:putative 3-hydroxy-3-methylglutaryl-coenzyme A reductase 3 [Iris pallida]